ncbi:DUF1684 domain-containing protein [Leucobacter japonicus]|uniref:DUF1684 domain-containing protein n=1 Tax=Leucobacter japonicus TaxID=1461259 RepID=UPI0006A79413|nr:DUF1684 domain-containing protein [Leucobacter japonicus]
MSLTDTPATNDAKDAAAAAAPQAWQQWREERLSGARAPHGTASAVATVWLDAEPRELPGLPGAWSSDGATVTGIGLDGALADEAVEVALAPGESAEVGAQLVRVLQRGGLLAVRRLDPEAETRTTLTGIDAFAWSPEWVAKGRYDPAPESLRVDQADGGETEFSVAGRVTVTVGGTEVSLAGFRNDTGVWASFADTTNGAETKQFRFIDVALPEGHDVAQTVTVDWNRAYLPPCSFTPAYLCPIPPADNRLSVAVRAGERYQEYAAS